LRDQFWQNLRIVGTGEELNQSLENANRVSDFLELSELMCIDALQRTESCGGHFRVESQTADGEAKRDDEDFAYTAAWEWTGPGMTPIIHKEPLTFEYVPLSQTGPQCAVADIDFCKASSQDQAEAALRSQIGRLRSTGYSLKMTFTLAKPTSGRGPADRLTIIL
jgi:Fumarate reductase flavoprotein C-term